MTASNARAIAIASGKGGVGKSCVALNLSVALARLEQRVLLVDADLGLGDTGTLLGISPEHAVEDVLRGACSVDQAATEGPAGVVVLPAAADVDAEFWEGLQPNPSLGPELTRYEADFDYIVVDTGAGIGSKVVDFGVAVDEAWLLITPEPAAIADAYATLKVLLRADSGLVPALLVNMADSAAEAEDLHAKFAEIIRRFLGARIDNRGYIPLDRYVREAAKRQTAFVLADPPSPAAQAMVQLAGSLLEEGPTRQPRQEGVLARALRQRESLGPRIRPDAEAEAEDRDER